MSSNSKRTVFLIFTNQKMAKVEVQIISRETIKPSSPTPPHLRTFNLSLLDQINTRLYVPFVFFYSNVVCDTTLHTTSADISHKLKDSLSKILIQYYPFAGRLMIDGLTIDCNDQGVDFLETQIKSQLSDFLHKGYSENLNLLFPCDLPWKNPSGSDSSLVSVQISFFQCGGMAISVCVSHKLADGCSIITFLNDWATITGLPNRRALSAEFIANSSLHRNVDPIVTPEVEIESKNCVTKRFVFNATKLAELKALFADSGIQNPTRVQLVTGLLYKCAMASSLKKWGFSRQSILFQFINLRPRMDPPLEKNSIGNFTWYFMMFITRNGGEMKLEEVVGQLRNGMVQFCDKSSNNLKLNEWLIKIDESFRDIVKPPRMPNDIDVYRCSSFCRYPLYEVDFGWGKPVRVCLADDVQKNSFFLMDTQKGDGIEAMVTMEEEDMATFCRNEELLAFAAFI